ncbi:hypothetical protein [Paenibacillus arenosi]|uniref:Uncharacterized protein n=1 Tax=Paenibacillus arenosi TaxID=2774142 RepID=A0ABR9B3Q5_9BACL|nr:hypothetical protein [Paenibacillus arenosi]MBD8500062.1 hypothetical protein [Paenibacillus arenosi]
MKLNAYLVDSIEVVELEDGDKKIVSSAKVNTVQVPTLPFVNDLKIRIDLSDLVVGEKVKVEVHIFNSEDKLVAFSGVMKIKATKTNLSTWCQMKLVHTSISVHEIRLYANGERIGSEPYNVEFDTVNQKPVCSS